MRPSGGTPSGCAASEAAGLGSLGRKRLMALAPRPVFRPIPRTPFAAYCGVAFLSNAGGWMQVGAVPLIMYQATESAMWVGLVGVASFLPSMLATIPGGVIADRFSRKLHLAINQSLLAGVTAVMWLLAAKGTLTPLQLLLLLSVQYTLIGMSVPSWQALIHELVPRSRMAAAVNLNSAQAQLAKVIGPGVAGLVLAWFGASWAFGINALTFLVAAVVMLFLPIPHPDRPRRGNKVLADLREGFGYSINNGGTRLCIIVAFAAMALGGPAYQLTAVVAEDVLEVGAAFYGLLLAAFGFGALAGNAFVATAKSSRGRRLPAALALYGLAVAGVGVVTNTAVATLLLFGMGLGYLVVTVTAVTAVQMLTPQPLRGRVIAVYSFAYIGGVPVGSAIQGWLVQNIGLTATLVPAGLAMTAIAAYLWIASHLTDQLDRDEELIDIAAMERETASTDQVPALR